mmetsp:Transcript_56780/g.161107  ORF Transcript_56780/g.161107 Transcript_56780/m.161107 type:complete len:659 (-) Transcript_56780:263-2239(-)
MAGALAALGSRHAVLHRLLPAAGVLSGLAVLLAKVRSARLLSVQIAILALRSSTPLAFIVVIRNLLKFARTKHQWRLKPALWYGASAWAMAEAMFLFYILEYKRRLDSQTTRRWQAVTVHGTEEKRAKSLERYLLSLTQVCKSGDASAPESGPRAPRSITVDTGGAGLGGGTLRRATLHSGHSSGPGLLRHMSGDLLRGVSSFSSQNLLFGAPPKHEESVADLLKLWDGQDNISDSDLQRLKLVELSSFFWGPGRGESEDICDWLRRGNVEEWVAHYWFRGATPKELDARRGERQELRNLVDVVLKDASVQHMAGGYNEKVYCYRTFTDPLPVIHRPLLVYVGTSVLVPLLTLQVMGQMGFHRERVGGLSYWKREPRRDVAPDVDINGGPQTPMVFVHGLGVGLLPYYLFIYRLSRRHSGDFYVPEFPCLAMAPWESVPSAREVVAQLQDMLAANGHTAAHFVGHSFGSLIIGWVIKMSPSSVMYTTLMEPAQFLMMKSECLCKVLYGTPQTCFEMVIRYFGFRELFTVNLLCRNFFWEQSTMWPENINVPTLIELAGADHIVQSLFVTRLLEHERTARKQIKKKSRRMTGSAVDVRGALSALQGAATQQPTEVLDICWFDGHLHGEILLRPRSQDKLFAKMRQMRAQGDKDKETGGR